MREGGRREGGQAREGADRQGAEMGWGGWKDREGQGGRFCRIEPQQRGSILQNCPGAEREGRRARASERARVDEQGRASEQGWMSKGERASEAKGGCREDIERRGTIEGTEREGAERAQGESRGENNRRVLRKRDASCE